MSQSRDSDIDPNIYLDLFFASNQTFNIFYPKILHASFLASYLLCTDLNIIFYILVLAFSSKKILHALQSQD